jgi:AraC-like DNA-binding protein
MIHTTRPERLILYTRPDLLVVFRRDVIAAPHRHHAIQLTVGLEAPVQAQIQGMTTTANGFLIDRDTLHAVVGQDGWVATLLLNPETPRARSLRAQRLHGIPIAPLAPTLAQTLADLLSPLHQHQADCPSLGAIVGQLWEHLLDNTNDVGPIDQRIADAIAAIQSEYDIPQRLAELATTVALSPGRFGHLFSAEVGLPLRRYLRWQRLLGALDQIASGETFTVAAHAAGFSDSAHLSRTFREMFGLSLSTLLTPHTPRWIWQYPGSETSRAE